MRFIIRKEKIEVLASNIIYNLLRYIINCLLLANPLDHNFIICCLSIRFSRVADGHLISSSSSLPRELLLHIWWSHECLKAQYFEDLGQKIYYFFNNKKKHFLAPIWDFPFFLSSLPNLSHVTFSPLDFFFCFLLIQRAVERKTFGCNKIKWLQHHTNVCFTI